MAKEVTLESNGVTVYPQTKAGLVLFDDESSLTEKMTDHETRLNAIESNSGGTVEVGTNTENEFTLLITQADGTVIETPNLMGGGTVEPVLAEDFSLSDSFLSSILELNTTVETSATGTIAYTPSNANSEKTINWTVTPSGVVRVSATTSRLTLTALSIGTATLTGTLENGTSHSYNVEVSYRKSWQTIAEYDFTGGNSQTLSSLTQNAAAATVNGNVTFSSDGISPDALMGSGAVIVPLSESGLRGKYRFTLDYGAFTAQPLTKASIHAGRFFDFVSATLPYIRAQVMTSSVQNEGKYQLQEQYNNSGSLAVMGTIQATNLYISQSAARFVVTVNTSNSNISVTYYTGAGHAEQGSFTATCTNVSNITRVILGNRSTLDGALPVNIKGFKVEKYM